MKHSLGISIITGIAWLSLASWLSKDGSRDIASAGRGKIGTLAGYEKVQGNGAEGDIDNFLFYRQTRPKGDTVVPGQNKGQQKSNTARQNRDQQKNRAKSQGSSGTDSRGERTGDMNEPIQGKRKSTSVDSTDSKSSGTSGTRQKSVTGTSGTSPAASRNTDQSKRSMSANDSTSAKSQRGSSGTRTTGERGNVTWASGQDSSRRDSSGTSSGNSNSKTATIEPVKNQSNNEGAIKNTAPASKAATDSTRQGEDAIQTSKTFPPDSATRSQDAMSEGSTGTHSTGERGGEAPTPIKRKGGN